MHVVQNTNDGKKIERTVIEGQIDRGRLHKCPERNIRRQHTGRQVASRRLGKLTACQFEKFATATTNIQPSHVSRVSPCTIQDSVDKKPFSAMEMDRVARESISEWIIKQLLIRSCVQVELRGFLLGSFQGRNPFTPNKTGVVTSNRTPVARFLTALCRLTHPKCIELSEIRRLIFLIRSCDKGSQAR